MLYLYVTQYELYILFYFLEALLHSNFHVSLHGKSLPVYIKTVSMI